LKRAFQDGSDPLAREDLCLASLFGGLALANAKLGAVHGFASVLGGALAAPHGALCARLLPPVYAVNIKAMQQRQPEHPALGRYAEIARILTGDPEASPEDGAAWLDDLSHELAIPPLREYGLGVANFPEVIEKSIKASSMQGNPVRLEASELQIILEKAY
jgi:alcohol dehydrogenase class IV